jgi:hypothetical protein
LFKQTTPLRTVSLFQPTFLKKESEAYEITSLSVRPSVYVSPLITFEPIDIFLRHSVGRSCHLRWPRCRPF